jgi:hypothetical protein
MNGKKYILTSSHFKGEIVFEYNLKGFLRRASLEGVGGLTKPLFDWIWANLPTSLDKIEDYKKKAGNFKIDEVPVDLSFHRFWTEYGQKVGKKKMTENAWNKLPQKDKIAALLYIEKLRRTKRADGTAMPYPSTYLNQKYWEV